MTTKSKSVQQDKKKYVFSNFAMREALQAAQTNVKLQISIIKNGLESPETVDIEYPQNKYNQATKPSLLKDLSRLIAKQTGIQNVRVLEATVV